MQTKLYTILESSKLPFVDLLSPWYFMWKDETFNLLVYAGSKISDSCTQPDLKQF
jgi:hypothetical protein